MLNKGWEKIMSKYQIAVVDDEQSITKLIKLGLLDNFSCDVDTYNDSTIALDNLLKKTYDVIILDHKMPKILGMQIVQKLRTTKNPNSKTKIILITGYVEEAESYDSNLLDEVIFLQKPAPESRIIRWVSFILKTDTKKSTSN